MINIKLKFIFIIAVFLTSLGCAAHKHGNTKKPCNCPNVNDNPRYKRHSFMDYRSSKNISYIVIDNIS